MLTLECMTDRVDLGGRGLERDARLQASTHDHERRGAVRVQRRVAVGARHRDWDPDVARADAGALKSVGRDANDRERAAIEADRAADDVGRLRETARPEPVAEDDDRARARLLAVGAAEQTTGRGRHAEHAEIVERHRRRERLLDAGACAGVKRHRTS